MTELSGLFPFAIFGLFAVLIIVFGIIANKRAEARRLALAALAQRLGFDYLPGGLVDTRQRGFWESLVDSEPTPELRFIERFQGFSPFGQGHSPEVMNLLVGNRDGIDWYLFDYIYKVTTSNGKTTQTTSHPHGVVAARVPMMLPKLSLQPENFMHRIGAKLGMQDLKFELEEFNRRYCVQSGEPRLAHDILHPQAIDFLMRHPVRFWQMGAMYIMVTTGGHFEPEEAARAMEEVKDFIGLVPEYVRQDRAFAATWSHPLD